MTMQPKTVLVCVMSIAFVGCAHKQQAEPFPSDRVSANPPEFRASSPTSLDLTKAFSLERDSLQSTVNELRDELEQLRLLFRLQNAPIADALPAVRPPVKVTVSTPTATSSDALAGAKAVNPRPVVTHAAPTPIGKAAAADLQNEAATYSALFRFASTTLDTPVRASLSVLKPQLLAAKSIEVKAYADTSGDAGLNTKLALARAQAMQRELLDLGVERQRIQLRAAVADSAMPEQSTLLGLFGAGETSRRVDLSLTQQVAAR